MNEAMKDYNAHNDQTSNGKENGYVVDLTEQEILKKLDNTDKLPEDFILSEFNQKVEESFQKFLEQTKKELESNWDLSRWALQEKFNTWIDKESEELNWIRDNVIYRDIIAPVDFTLSWFSTVRQLNNLDGDIIGKEYDLTIHWNNDIKVRTFGINGNEIANIFNEHHFKNEGKLFDLLQNATTDSKTLVSEDIKKFQRIIAQIDENDDTKDHTPETNKKLGNNWVDWKFWKDTLRLLKDYAEKYPVETQESDEKNQFVSESNNNEKELETNKRNTEFENRYQSTPSLNVGQAKEILNYVTEQYKAGELETLGLGELKSIEQNVANVLKDFPWKIELKALTSLTTAVLQIFMSKDSTCTVDFKGWSINKKDGTYYIKLNNSEEEHTIEEITDILCKQLIGIEVTNNPNKDATVTTTNLKGGKIWATVTGWGNNDKEELKRKEKKKDKDTIFEDRYKNTPFLSKEQAKEVVDYANKKGYNTLQLEKLELINPDIANALKDFPWKIQLPTLASLTTDVLQIFMDKESQCTVEFKGWSISKEDGTYYIILNNSETKITVDKINDGLCKQLIGVEVTNNNSDGSGLLDEVWGTPESNTDLYLVYQNSPTLTVEETNRILNHAKEEEFEKIALDKLVSIEPEVANVLKDFQWKIELKALTSLTTDVLQIFMGENSQCTVEFKGWSINKKDGTYYIILNNSETKITVDKINDGLCKQLIGVEVTENPKENATVTTTNPKGEKIWATVTDWGKGWAWKDKINGTDTSTSKNETRNEYKNLTNDKYWESSEQISSDFDAIIAYMKWTDDKNLTEDLTNAFKRLQVDPKNLANVLAQILEENENKNITNYTKEHISNAAIKQLWKNKTRFVDKKGELIKILNNVDVDHIRKFINEMRIFNDIKDLQNTKNYIEKNKTAIIKNPFLALADFSRNGWIDRGDEWLKNKSKTSEQAMYDDFVWSATKKEWLDNEIIDWPETRDLIEWFVSLIKSVWNGNYDDIDSEFNWSYTMENLWNYIVNHYETLELYHQTLNKLLYNTTIGIRDIISLKRRENLINKNMKKIENLSTNRDEIQKRFESKMNQNEDLKKRFDSLSAEEQKNWRWNLAVWLDEGGLFPSIVKAFWVTSKTWVTVDKLNDVEIKFGWIFKDWLPRISLCLPMHTLDVSDPKKYLWSLTQTRIWLHIDIPIANLTTNFDLNKASVENSVINGVNPIYQLYTRLWANVLCWFSLWETPSVTEDMENAEAMEMALKNADLENIFHTWRFYLSWALEAALWVNVNYKKGIESKSRNFGNVLQNQIFNEPDFNNKELFVKKAKESIDKILKSTWKTKNDIGLKSFMANNKQEMLNCVDNVSAILDMLWVFDNKKDPKHKEILLNSILKWIVEGIKDKNISELNWMKRLTSVWIFWQAWLGFDLEKVFKNGFKSQWFGYSVWLEGTVSAWNITYKPDKEKYEYMDSSLKSWESIESVDENLKTNNLENIETAIKKALTTGHSIPGIKVEANDKSQIEISVTDEILEKYKKENIYKLLNIYVNPEKNNNIAISEDGKKLIIWGNELKYFSVATRKYFDDFAVYLMIWWKWITGCKNNKINEETIKEYNSKEHIDGVHWFEFKPSYSEETISEVLLPNETTSWFDNFEQALSKIDDQRWNQYVAFMEETCDVNDNEIVDINDYKDAFEKVKKLLNDYSKDNSLKDIKEIVKNITDDDEKAYVVDRFKMIFALISWKDTVSKIRKLNRWDAYEGLKWYATKWEDFPLKWLHYREKLLDELWSDKLKKGENSNLIWMTAFYKRWYAPNQNEAKGKDVDALNAPKGTQSTTTFGKINRALLGRQLDQAYWYSMTEIWSTRYIWQLLPIDGDRLEDTKNWFIKNLEKTEVHKNILKKEFIEKIGCNEINDDNLFKLLRWEEVEFNIDKRVKKVRIDAEYVFYLLRECANESIWINLKSMTITTPNNDDETWENILEVWEDGQTLTKIITLNQNDVKIKESIWTFKSGEPYDWTTWFIPDPDDWTFGESE